MAARIVGTANVLPEEAADREKSTAHTFVGATVRTLYRISVRAEQLDLLCTGDGPEGAEHLHEHDSSNVQLWCLRAESEGDMVGEVALVHTVLREPSEFKTLHSELSRSVFFRYLHTCLQ
eukprot:3046251-Pleurochrysis_carterae.AAC.1